MTEIKLKTKSLWRWPRRILTLTLILAVICVIAFSVLANIGGSSDEIKNSLQGFLTELTGYEAEIETLNSVNFFPVIIFDFENMTLFEKPEEGGVRAAPVVTADKIYIARSFWDYTFQNNKVKAMAVENFYAKPGAITQQAISVKTLRIEDRDDDNAMLIGSGQIDAQDFIINTPLKRYGTAPNQSYEMTDKAPIALQKTDGTIIPFRFEQGKLLIDMDTPADE